MTPLPLTLRREHSHVFDDGNPLAERNTRWAVILTASMMVIEIAGGWMFNSMALLADGWHMSSHALALGLSVLAYSAARKLAKDRRFSLGTWKIEVLAGYTSAVLLVLVAALMLFQSVERLLDPSPIHYNQAIVIGIVGLGVNLACAWLLRGGGHEHHHHDHGHGHTHDHHQDLNLRSAYIHVIADAATSVLAIVALFGGKLWGASWLDPLMGIVGAVLVAAWAYSLMRDSGKILLDAEMDAPVVEEIRQELADSGHPLTITDLHLGRIGKGKYQCVLALSSADNALTADRVRQLLAVHQELVHITVEINRPPLAQGVVLFRQNGLA
ncbi:CDF family Co(II)/Ni(II) efflux transporter DmeF [Serratia quinivorans]|uniref:CDF family Co(II)/Ni(II) efflux transporter DmeF n=1 Tax=Serratia quinivorans TaxID=137545 RepID=UPI002177BFFB|nr:CDF family Co(II)/Ni(II) efflux transporter DmeF [Serratia quinivorans]CAI0916329.1 Cadmium, cobalt and zinc/H(+)-K(+) antiporter [Serratia quinivorans]CAI0943960.1 Cadmium, cobalt and zinc/H(+)-K(+) antiporter [Serratia quinivorans]CAI0965570.1 Cadmium, cobalt and zinc/H(+)-K(+) antiporter [Serratia quinivorans]CAI1553905.1 Cadmium, cobalt and zinc/H(+)-K(+) antiporter [Serratia quinivorans]CAI2069163.1 Cadmium, cobalt and zinc/H(+)-K(+) antiporter [Serratia quinivorans]